jgi:hypothetical protein
MKIVQYAVLLVKYAFLLGYLEIKFYFLIRVILLQYFEFLAIHVIT